MQLVSDLCYAFTWRRLWDQRVHCEPRRVCNVVLAYRCCTFVRCSLPHIRTLLSDPSLLNQLDHVYQIYRITRRPGVGAGFGVGHVR